MIKLTKWQQRLVCWHHTSQVLLYAFHHRLISSGTWPTIASMLYIVYWVNQTSNYCNHMYSKYRKKKWHQSNGTMRSNHWKSDAIICSKPPLWIAANTTWYTPFRKWGPKHKWRPIEPARHSGIYSPDPIWTWLKSRNNTIFWKYLKNITNIKLKCMINV